MTTVTLSAYWARMGRTASIQWVTEDGDTLDFEARALRPTGAFLPSDLMLEHGEELSVQMQLPGIGKTILRAQVVSVDLRGDLFGMPGMGIAFRGLEQAERSALRRLSG